MRVHVVVGSKGKGKSTFVKNLLSKVGKDHILIYDVNAEYKDFFPYPFVKKEKFLGLCKQVANAVIVFEEATIYFSNRGNSEEMIEVMTRCRHTKNYIIMVFHSLRAVPLYIYDMINYLTIFQTNDSSARVDQKFKDDRLNEAFKKINESKDKHENITIGIN